MATVTEHIRAHLLAFMPRPLPDLDSLRKTEQCPEFERLRSNRMIMGAIRYGMLGAPGKKKYNRTKCMIRRLTDYERDRNAEHLVDVANLSMLEFVEGDHLGVMSQDDGQHTAAIS